MNKLELESLLRYYDDLYYNQDNPEISDYEYDSLKNSYIELYGEYNYVPGEASKDSTKFSHTTNVSSLDKVQITDVEALKSHIKRLWPVVIQPKMDGLTLVTYPGFVHVTRGNGKVGEVVSANVDEGVSGVGKVFTEPIRSEVVMLKSEFNKINAEKIKNGEEPFKNPRNAAAGMLRQKDSSKVKGLKAFAYNIIYDEERNNAYPQLLSLKQYGWNTVDNFTPETEEEALEYLLSYDRSLLDYEIDGLVIKHDGVSTFGSTGHHPKSAVAVKFEAEGGWTTINRIIWQVGRTGKITPVADFDPIEILGGEITRATLHNFGVMNALKLTHIEYEGKYNSKTKVFVIKANDVIPAIIEVKQPNPEDINEPYMQMLHEPTKCPKCDGKVEKINDQLFCTSETCPSKIIGKLVHMAKRDAFDIGGLSEETAKKIMDTLVFEESPHPSVIYDFNIEDFMKLEGFAKKSATNLYNEIQKTLTIPFDRFLYGCGLPLVGRTASKDIAEFYYNPEKSEVDEFADDYFNDFKKLKDLKGIGKETIQSLINNFETMIVPFGERSMNITDVIPKKKAVNQLVFVITGEFDIPRKDIKAIIEESGHKVSGSVSKKTNYLLAAPGEDGTSKYQKAKELGISIINSVDDLKNVIG